MSKLTHFASMALVSLSFSVQAQSISLPYTDNFDYLTIGDTDDSNGPSSSSMESGMINNCSTARYLYQAGGKLKFGSGNKNGIFTTVDINPENAESITVEFDAISWTKKNSELEITYGTQTKTVTLDPCTFPVVQDDLKPFTVEFKAEDNAKLSFKSGISGEKRMFLDNLSIKVATATGIENNLSSSVSVVGAKGMIIVDAKEAGTVEIYNFAGKLVVSGSISTGHNEINIEKGLYIVNINGEVAKVAVQ